MEKLNFLPLWEIERLNKRKRKNSYIFLFVLIFFNILLTISIIYNINRIKKIKVENTYKSISKNDNYKDRKIETEKKVNSLESYQWYNKEIRNEINLKEMIIKDKEIIIVAKSKDYNDYINVVNYIENKCKVKDVSIAKFNENYLEFSITMEAKHE